MDLFLQFSFFLCKCPKRFGRLSHQISFSVTCERERGNERGEIEWVWKEREGEMVTQNTQEASSVIINIAVGAKKCFEKRQFCWRSYFWDENCQALSAFLSTKLQFLFHLSAKYFLFSFSVIDFFLAPPTLFIFSLFLSNQAWCPFHMISLLVTSVKNLIQKWSK